MHYSRVQCRLGPTVVLKIRWFRRKAADVRTPNRVRSSRRAVSIPKEYAVNAVMVVLLAVGWPMLAVGISDLQSKLERWDYQRHAQD